MTSSDDQRLVADAFSELEKGITKKYDALLAQMRDGHIEDETYIQILKGLQEHLTELGRDKELLVGIVLKYDWTNRHKKVIHLYQKFILSLLSAHTFYLKAVLRMIVKNFLPPPGCLVGNPPDASEEDKITHTKSFLQLHMLLKQILELVPMSPSVLLPLLTEVFPYYTRPGYLQQCYTRNLLQLAIYLPGHRVHILELIIDKMTKLDVLSPKSEIMKVEDMDSDDDDDMDIFDMEGVLPPSAAETQAEKKVHVEASKLDLLMEEMLHSVTDICKPNNVFEWPPAKSLFMDLLRVFDKIILPTHACCHVQYIMFYLCSLKDVLCDSFLDYLWKKVQNPMTQPIFRQAAVAYIGSLVSRGMFVPSNTVKHVLELILPWVHNYVREVAEIETRADVTLHGPFYSVCQAVFYIFVFRHRDLLALPGGVKFCQALNFQTIVTCRLNPLRFCLPTVVNRFTSVARQHQIAFCDTVIERNKRSFLPESGSQFGKSSHLTNLNPLDSFFPFDPYMLPRSFKFIEPLYREYDGNDDEDDEPALENQEEDFMDVGSLTDRPQFFGMSPHSLIKSPISPTCTDLLRLGTSPGFQNM